MTKEKFEEIEQILMSAFSRDMLTAGNPCYCAIGNIVAYKMGYKGVPRREASVPYYYNPCWYQLINEDLYDDYGPISKFEFDPVLKNEQIKSIGLDEYDIFTIEQIFEDKFNDSYQSLDEVLEEIERMCVN